MTDMRDDSSSIGMSLLTFLLGAAVGAAVAILYAPQTGVETRQQIAEKAGQLKDKASDIKDQVVDKASQWKDRAANMIQQAGERTADAANVTADQVRNTGVPSEASSMGSSTRG